MINTETTTTSQVSERNRRRVLTLLPDVSGREGSVRKIIQMARSGAGSYVCLSTVHMVMEAFDDPEFAQKVNSADLVITDGMPLVWMQKLQNAPNAERFRGNDLTIALMEQAEKEGLKVGFYGGKPEVIERLVERARKDFPKLEISYAFAPPFRQLSEEEDAEISCEIKRSGVEILFVGLGCPKQECWMYAHRDKISAVMLGVGAAFDFYAGNVKESPKWISDIGFEWLYRLFQEPKRLWRRYLILNPRFLFWAALQLLGLKKFDGK